jgi:polar amino acid transport system substrate-binding protein
MRAFGVTAAVVSLLILTPQAGRAAEAGPKPLVFCAEPSSLPRTGRAPDGSAQGLDTALAQLLGRSLGRNVEFHWCVNAACAWRCLRAGRCEVVLGQPHNAEGARDIAWSVPYAGSQFGLVVPQEAKGIQSLADLRGKRVGVVTGTVALSEQNHALAHFKTREELLDGLQKADLTAAFLDADFAAWYLHAHPKLNLRLVAEYVPREHWNMAVAVLAENAKLLVEINRVLAQLSESGELKKAYADLGVPYRPPFTDTARRTATTNTWKRIQDRGELVVSMDPANLPYSSAKDDRPGFDVELARALARELGVKLRLDWLNIQRETAMGKLLGRECDLVFGAAVDPNAVEDDDELAGKVIYLRPYYGTGYLLVERKQGPHCKSLAELKGPKSERLGTEAGSVADYRLRQRGHLRRLFRNQLAVLKALHDGDIDHAYLWANVGWTLHASPDFALEVVPGYVPEDHWDIAVAMRQEDSELKRHVDVAVAKMVKDGTVARALARYHVQHFPPFEEEKESGAKAEAPVIRHSATNRGLEPQMQGVQTSKHPYGGLGRVRSGGELVVGLDQNNLPFSTAHPKPAGLDYEIAGLLAEQLGLSLRVYWAYSAHDSYPSKLATKNLCDVILGVMPDDRFAKRVLYSKPYYFAAYQLVVRAGDTSPARLEQLGDEPLAIERGVAVRGLQGREVRPYPSLEGILEAVVNSQAQAGYVISTRGQWLAERRWPGKLKFVDGPTSLDRFAICAAVRKSEGDLKAALDRAFAELDRSGRLAPVFARWHIPYASPHVKEGASK